MTQFKFLNYIEQHRKIIFDVVDQERLKTHILEDSRKQLEQSDLINKLKILRDNNLAHKDNSILGNNANIWKNSEIATGDFRNLLRFGGSVINYYLYISGENEQIKKLIEFIRTNKYRTLPYDDTLVRKIIQNVTVYEDHFVISLKSGVEI